MKTRSLRERFFAKVSMPADENSCWGWSAATHKDGYPWIRRAAYERMDLAHRISWGLHFGPIPDGLYVLHRCDNPVCTNPKHLFLGTQIDNMKDMTGKGRRVGRGGLPGTANAKAKLDDYKVLEIRALFNNGGVSFAALSRKFDIAAGQIRAIVRRTAWRHI